MNSGDVLFQCVNPNVKETLERMNKEDELSAYDVINKYEEEKLSSSTLHKPSQKGTKND